MPISRHTDPIYQTVSVIILRARVGRYILLASVSWQANIVAIDELQERYIKIIIVKQQKYEAVW